jgi:hypothetical protein|tara:strand:+ start:762 stop:947 length:186 start_codon:yes stop_codon:yes gene_type:complete
MEFLSGKKTYIIAVLMVAVGIVNALTGDVTAWQGVIDNALIILAGTGFATVRSGITTETTD